MRDPSRVERFQNFHDLPVRLLHRSLRASGSGVITATEPTPGGTTDGGPTRNGLVRLKGDQLSAGREPTCPSTEILACPLSRRPRHILRRLRGRQIGLHHAARQPAQRTEGRISERQVQCAAAASAAADPIVSVSVLMVFRPSAEPNPRSALSHWLLVTNPGPGVIPKAQPWSCHMAQPGLPAGLTRGGTHLAGACRRRSDADGLGDRRQGAAVADHASAYTQEDQQHEGHRPRDDPGGRQGEESEGA